MTKNLISTTKAGVGRKKTNFEQMPARFADGTFASIDSVLLPGENRADFLRIAVENEVKRRGRKPRPSESPLNQGEDAAVSDG